MQATCEKSRQVLIDVVLEGIDRCPGAKEALSETAWQQIESVRRRRGNETSDIEKEAQDLETQSARIAEAIAQGGNIQSLVAKAKTIEKQLKIARKRLEENVELETAPALPATREQFQIEPRQALLELARTSFEFSDLIRKVVPHFVIQPIQALDTGQVHARAIFTLDPGALVQCPEKDRGQSSIGVDVIERDLFEPPIHIRNVTRVVELWKYKLELDDKASLSVLAKELGTNRMTVQRALAYFKIMEQQQTPTLYRILQDEPKDVPRWHKRKNPKGMHGQAA